MITVILAGGLGKRLRPLTSDRPKPMIQINNTPIIELQVKWLKKFGITDIIVLVGHLREKIKHHLADGKKFGVNISYIEENVPLGTGGALKNAKDHIIQNGNSDPGFFVINGDILTNLDPFTISEKGSMTLALVPMKSTFGIVETNGDLVSKFIEKPSIEDMWINAGVYYFSNEIFDYLPDKGNLETVTLPMLVEKQKLKAKKFSNNYWRSIDSHKDVDEASKEIEQVFKK
ncbi:MAG: nucleotidyltransferase family protein [Nitrososphaeraceae archaeon]|nr:nucleotidyltransferase family protein [Nitrososphaeraceae archaeon]MDW0175434.1 nucleotidyltransferase family protein [Nitrososphaeraceae archaeon]MDW0179818.1 nucleotidyltransferase family protein [Nitrososphaeraceae archaeon]MDW0193805.1 nucleotidyltransferase family protein [Nitrososphaeraceae archaeon]MDW0196110.1 nucleotidyltransferase family protein [Nitrososphaeraceae archaeon]